VTRSRTDRLRRLTLCALAALAFVPSPARAQVRQALSEAQIEYPADAADDNFGWSAADAGDVDGDGTRDMIVGAIYNDGGGKDAGKAYVFRGGPAPTSARFVTMTGTTANEQFACSVDGAGDVNGDGYADVIVGARLNDLGGNASGGAFIYFGGPAMDGVRDVSLRGEAAADWMGNAVAGAGDVNGDGYGDVIVGAPYNDRGGSAAGAAYLFFGGPAMDAVPDVILIGEIHDDQFGWSVAGAGDIDGDGFADVVVGARMHCVDGGLCPGAAYARGRAYLFRGGPAMDAIADVVFDGDAANDWFGQAVAGIGDVDGDGRDDVAVGAIYADTIAGGNTLSSAGSVSVYFGGNPMDGTRDALLAGDQADGQFGWAIAAAGDVNGDGRRDISATTHFFGTADITGAGRVEVFSGGPAITRPPLATLVGEGSNVQLGQSIAGAELYGPDQPAVLIAGQVYSRDVGPGSGKAFVFAPFCVALSMDPVSIGVDACYPFDTFDVYRGEVGIDLPAGSSGQCLQTGLTASSTIQDSDNPLPGSAFFYLVTGRTASLEGALGFGSSGLRRPNNAPCP
jgi:hypothetical protein